MSCSDGDGRRPSKGFFGCSYDVGEIIEVRVVRQSISTSDLIELMLGGFHDVRVPDHRQELLLRSSRFSRYSGVIDASIFSPDYTGKSVSELPRI